MMIRVALLLSIAATVPVMPASAAKIGALTQARDCPKQPPMLVAIKRCPGLPPMLIGTR